MADIKTILCPTDFSPASLAAIDHGIAFAHVLGAGLCVVHVCPLLLYAIAPGAVPDAPQFEAEVKAKLRQKLDELGASLRTKGVAVETVLVDGNPGNEIVELAKQRGAGLIAMSTHGRTGLSRLTLGSVAERVVRTAAVPVLTVHPA